MAEIHTVSTGIMEQFSVYGTGAVDMLEYSGRTRNTCCLKKGRSIAIFRLFGTYEPERKDEEIAYGLVKPVASFNQLLVKAALWPPAYFPGTRTKPFFLWLSMEDHTEGT
ncbi:hypothetical protein COOONC_21550 [Cooperia oncophora]